MAQDNVLWSYDDQRLMIHSHYHNLRRTFHITTLAERKFWPSPIAFAWIMADRRIKKPMRCEYYGILAICVLGLGLQVWLLVKEFFQTSVPIITQNFDDMFVPPAVTICIPWKYSVTKSEWLSFIIHVLQSPIYNDAFKALANWTGMEYFERIKLANYHGCKRILKSANE